MKKRLLSMAMALAMLAPCFGLLTLASDPEPVSAPVVEEAAAKPAAEPVTQRVEVNGTARTMRMYAIRDAGGNDSYYIAIRDLAQLLNDTGAQFNVGWSGTVSVETQTPYRPGDGDSAAVWGGGRSCRRVSVPTGIDGEVRDLDAVLVQDETGGGSTYYKLRDLCRILGVTAGWTAERGVWLEAPALVAEGDLMVAEAEKYLGVPYVWGGCSPSGFDCSGFTYYVINHCGSGRSMTRTGAQALYNQCVPVSWDDATAGDLVFFTKTYSANTTVTHVGVFVGEGKMIHAGSKGIQRADLTSSYWQSHFYSFGRLP